MNREGGGEGETPSSSGKYTCWYPMETVESGTTRQHRTLSEEVSNLTDKHLTKYNTFT